MNKSATRSEDWSPQAEPLSEVQISQIIAALKGHKKFKQAVPDAAFLREDINDLLVATGVAISNEEERYFREGEIKRSTQAQNIHQEYLADRAKEIAEICAEALQLCSTDGADQYFRDLLDYRELELRRGSTLTTTMQLFETARELLASQDVSPENAALMRNDPFFDRIPMLISALDLLATKVRSFELSPQLNAAIRRELNDVYANDRTIQIDYSSVVASLNAIKKAGTRLADYERAQIREGRPSDELVDTLLLGLADIFLIAVKSDKPPSRLAASSTSVFIAFCIDVLQHYFPPDQLQPAALAKRWQRLRKLGY